MSPEISKTNAKTFRVGVVAAVRGGERRDSSCFGGRVSQGACVTARDDRMRLSVLGVFTVA